jgi:hypothetical protein
MLPAVVRRAKRLLLRNCRLIAMYMTSKMMFVQEAALQVWSQQDADRRLST